VKATTRTSQCIGFLIQLARAADSDAPTSLAQVSERTGISRRYLEQLAIVLKNAGLIRGVTGRGGGYTLARTADTISIHDIVTAASGPVSFAGCVADSLGCMSAEFCQCRPLWMIIDHEIEKVLNAHFLEDLVDRSRLTELQSRARSLPPPGGAEPPWTPRNAPEIARGGG
jgi:Rrf2 family iron-sulfur cluster assembly transcriptional regulator